MENTRNIIIQNAKGHNNNLKDVDMSNWDINRIMNNTNPVDREYLCKLAGLNPNDFKQNFDISKRHY